MKRRVVQIDEIRQKSDYFCETQDYSVGVCGLVDVENMGFCKDGVTRWYMFHLDDEPVIYFKR